ncbi:LLM class flavin-dependent oxidoreductase [Spongiactinospora sp. TRM90649]|uniref:LLM class flavin-dependent oxidoreductase n=1 Tax=Spongiactinospora sp. TRM90649 TaxID=3031114 RepID=UPI0023F929F2|nr:LLM class flavin-dependent oxidoreductase [Spongiactinospora sp. TRM90649]MDF5752769.1 LLM class flavin-dependent oxidoreductase [Spongiactinospora sp. TRM90649]
MREAVKVGVYLPPFGGYGDEGPWAHARHAEDVGLESVWVGDHLIPTAPRLDATMVLASAAAVTRRIGLGFGVMVPVLRGAAWVAKQVVSLQHLSGDRVLLGVGVGGPVHGDMAFRAVGVPYRERGRRTDELLAVLPDLVEGRTVDLDGHEVTLSPGADMPPLLIAGGAGSEPALRRVARYADEWFPAFTGQGAFAASAQRIAELAAEYGRPVPGLTLSVNLALGEDVPAEVIEHQVRATMRYGMPEAMARASLVTGPPEEVARCFADLAEQGADRIIGMPFGEDRFRQSELLAETARLLGS